MQLHIYKDHNALSADAAERIIATLQNNPAAVLCLATGETPRLTYDILVRRILEEQIDISQCTFIGLDEWVGIPPDQEGSCSHFLHTNLFTPLHIAEHQVHLFDGMTDDTNKECQKMDEKISAKGGISLMIVGVGLNGHIGFNEPGTPADKYSHVIDLDETTREVGKKYFTQAASLKQGITLGFTQILKSNQLIMMANGSKKADVIKQAVEEAISTNLPATLIRTHPSATIMIDEEAAASLNHVPEN